MTRQVGRTCHIAFFISRLPATFRRGLIDSQTHLTTHKAPSSPFFAPNNMCAKCQLQKYGKWACVKPNSRRGGASQYLETRSKAGWATFPRCGTYTMDNHLNSGATACCLRLRQGNVCRRRVVSSVRQSSASLLRIFGSPEEDSFVYSGADLFWRLKRFGYRSN
jgi:hypothetical protein